MDQAYNEMMKWALGDDYASQNVKNAPKVWREKHPARAPLMQLKDKPSGANAYFFVFQLTTAWLAAHDYKCVLNCPSNEATSKMESQNVKESFSDILRVMWSDIVSCFKPKTRS